MAAGLIEACRPLDLFTARNRNATVAYLITVICFPTFLVTQKYYLVAATKSVESTRIAIYKMKFSVLNLLMVL